MLKLYSRLSSFKLIFKFFCKFEVSFSLAQVMNEQVIWKINRLYILWELVWMMNPKWSRASESRRSEAGEKRSRSLESESGVGGCCIISWQLSLAPQTLRYRTRKVQSLKATGSAIYNSCCHTSLHCGSICTRPSSTFTTDPAYG